MDVHVPSKLLERFILVPWMLPTIETNERMSVGIVSFLGIPLFACGGGGILLVDMLLSNGMSVGAASAFLIVGPATRITPLMDLASFVKPRAIAGYVSALLLFATVSGVLINYGLGT